MTYCLALFAVPAETIPAVTNRCSITEALPSCLQGNLVADAPEPQALQWAARNPWFGTDAEMTYYAYEVHDHLIEVEGMDPISKEYYEQIGLRVAAQFPERCGRLHMLV